MYSRIYLFVAFVNVFGFYILYIQAGLLVLGIQFSTDRSKDPCLISVCVCVSVCVRACAKMACPEKGAVEVHRICEPVTSWPRDAWERL